MNTINYSPFIDDRIETHSMMSNASILLICIVLVHRCVESFSIYPAPADTHVAESYAGKSVQILRDTHDSPNSRLGPKLNSTERLRRLREEMKKEHISAYIILGTDDHQSKFVADHDGRREFITGFTGSTGDAVVTLKSAALFTDSRYYEQAQHEMDNNWILMKTGDKTSPTVEEWLGSELKAGEKVSTDPRVCGCKDWKTWSEKLEKYNISMALVKRNLVDEIWPQFEQRPEYPDTPIIILDVKFTGLTWQQKLALTREDMAKAGIDVFVVTALDEIAWLLNLRGGEIPYTPLFRSYMIIEKTRASLYIPPHKVTPQIREHLSSKGNKAEETIQIFDYSAVWADLDQAVKRATKVGLPLPYSFAGGISYLVCQAVPPEKTVTLVSPILLRKDLKNEVEAAGMRYSHVRDAVALCQFLRRLEKEVTAGDKSWTELKAVQVVDELRAKQKYSIGPSFETISAFGENAGMPHYRATPENNAPITDKKLYMLDSGGQYLDGTTDVTRTMHYGTPRQVEKETYTRLLMGCINMGSIVFKKGVTLQRLEILVKQHLYEAGLDYGHGTTHGIGHFLVVHEAFNPAFGVNFFGSQEPGYYKENDYGMRLENIVGVVKANVTGNENGDYLTFEAITLVPYERKLIIPEMLERRHLNWLNEYHARVREVVGAEMLKQGLKEEYDWLVEKTKHISI